MTGRSEGAQERSVDWGDVRRCFPILDQEVSGRPLVYLDNAATTQVPECVVGAIAEHYRRDNANVHRSTHTLSARSTASLEQARATVRRFINAESAEEVVFTRGTTESVNLVAAGLAAWHGAGFSAVASALEHHSNFVPWQQQALRAGGSFAVAPLTEGGDLDEVALVSLLESRPRGIVALALVSNVLGTVSPVARLTQLAHERGWLVLVDAAQGMRHGTVDVQAMGCDFLCFSGHKMLGPTGIGVLYGRRGLLDELPPTAFGGEMVEEVSGERSLFERAPLRHEAGTPNYVGALALAAAIDFLEGVGREAVAERERRLLMRLEEGLRALGRVRVLGAPRRREGVISFTVENAHPLDVAVLMDKRGVAVRAGRQCAQPLLTEAYAVDRVVRMSPAFYNTFEEIDVALDCLERTMALLGS